MIAAAPRVTVLGAADADALPELATWPDRIEPRFAADLDTLTQHIADTEILLGWDFRADVLERAWPRAERLRWVHWAGAGVDAALFPAFRDSEVLLTNARGVFDQPIAEYVLGLILCFAKDFPGTVRAQAQHQWLFRYSESIQQQTALLVGVGSIGRAIGRLLRAAGMQITGVGREARGNDPVFGQVQALTDLPRLLPGADYVINITPSTAETRGLFDAQHFANMRPTARFINVGRGDAVDQAALTRALTEKRIAGAALDVFAAEPLPGDSPLWDLDNVVVSPHMSGDVRDAPQRLLAQFLDNLQRYLRGESLQNLVDKNRGY